MSTIINVNKKPKILSQCDVGQIVELNNVVYVVFKQLKGNNETQLIRLTNFHKGLSVHIMKNNLEVSSILRMINVTMNLTEC